MDAIATTVFNNLKKNPPVRAASLETFSATSGFELPTDYRNFLLLSNGAVGRVGKHHVILWPLEKLLEYNESYNVKEYAPSLFLFGSNGGGEAFAFDTNASMSVVGIPFVGLYPEDAECLAPSFIEFLKVLGAGD